MIEHNKPHPLINLEDIDIIENIILSYNVEGNEISNEITAETFDNMWNVWGTDQNLVETLVELKLLLQRYDDTINYFLDYQ